MLESQSNSKDCLLEICNVPLDTVDAPNQVKIVNWGIFTVAYDVASGPLFTLPRLSTLKAYIKFFPAFVRFQKDLWRIALWHTLKYYLFTAWLAMEPAVSLYLFYLVVFNVELLFQDQEEHEEIKNNIVVRVLAWLLCGVVSSLLEYIMVDLRADIGGALRADFTPKLVKASLEWDLDALDESLGYFPYEHEYGHFVPGWEFLEDTFVRMRHIVVVILEVVAVILIMRDFNGVNATVLFTLMFVFIGTKLSMAKNCVGGGGYTYWPTNNDYKRLMVLFNIVFDHKYRFTLVKDGLVDYLAEEYKTVSDSLGGVKADTSILSFNIPPPLYWGPVQYCILHFPVALGALSVLWPLSRSILGSMAILQYAISAMHPRIQILKDAKKAGDFLSIFKRVQRFYDILDKPPADQSVLDRPFSPEKGKFKMILRDVSYTYRSSPRPAVANVNLTIDQGQLIVICGENGSGKTTLMKLLTGLIKPTHGKIYTDSNGTVLQGFVANKFRKAVTFVTNSEEIYPVSLRENLRFGIADQADRDSTEDADFHKAAYLGGALDLINQRTYDAVLNPVTIASESIEDPAGQAAMDARERHSPNPVGVPFSTGEHQRFIASRAFLRINRGKDKIKLIILDESSNALDPQAENEVFKNFRDIAKENGQTLIVITHRLANIVNEANLILCMHEGRVVQEGTHAELMKSAGQYSKLYAAQFKRLSTLT